MALLQGQRALEAMESHMLTGIDLEHHRPNEVAITDESLTELGFALTLTSKELNHMKTVAQKLLTECIHPLANAKNVAKIVLSENHLYFSGRNDSGFDLVVLMNPDEDLQATAESIMRNVSVLTSGSVGTEAAHLKVSPSLQFDFQEVHVRIAVGHLYSEDEKVHREIVWGKIQQLDAAGKLKKVHLDQFAIDLFESQTMFMHHQVAPESFGGNSANERFVKGALRLARAWRQCNLSHRDIQFTPLDAWLVMLHAVHTEVSRSPMMEKQEEAAGVGGAVSGIRKTVKELFRKRGVTGKIQAGGHEVSMKNVFREFLSQLAKLEEMNIHFEDVYDQTHIPDWIKTQRPLVLDPVCPYRNTLFNLHKRVSEDLKKHATESIKMLDDPHATMPKLFQLPTYKKRGA